MSDDITEYVPLRDNLGRLLPGHTANKLGPPRRPQRPQFNRDKLVDVCVEKNYEPIAKLIDLSRDPNTTPYLQFEIHKEIASFLYAKRRTVVLSDENEQQATIKITWDDTHPQQREQFTKGMRNAEASIVEAIVDEDDS